MRFSTKASGFVNVPSPPPPVLPRPFSRTLPTDAGERLRVVYV